MKSVAILSAAVLSLVASLSHARGPTDPLCRGRAVKAAIGVASREYDAVIKHVMNSVKSTSGVGPRTLTVHSVSLEQCYTPDGCGSLSYEVVTRGNGTESCYVVRVSLTGEE